MVRLRFRWRTLLIGTPLLAGILLALICIAARSSSSPAPTRTLAPCKQIHTNPDHVEVERSQGTIERVKEQLERSRTEYEGVRKDDKEKFEKLEHATIAELGAQGYLTPEQVEFLKRFQPGSSEPKQKESLPGASRESAGQKEH